MSDGICLQYTNLDNYAKKLGFKNLKIHHGDKGHLDNKGAPSENFVVPEFK